MVLKKMQRAVLAIVTTVCATTAVGTAPALAQLGTTFSSPSALVMGQEPVDWIFVFKLNAGGFATDAAVPRDCAFGGQPKSYPKFSQAFATASSLDPVLKDGTGLAGTSASDPLGATFGEIYASSLHFVVWNDQFYQHPAIAGCSDSCSAPWGHS